MNFYAVAKMFDITYYQMLVKTHQSIGKVEKYYVPICHGYDII